MESLGSIFLFTLLFSEDALKLTESDGKDIYIFLNAIRLNVLNKESLKNIMFPQKY